MIDSDSSNVDYSNVSFVQDGKRIVVKPTDADFKRPNYCKAKLVTVPGDKPGQFETRIVWHIKEPTR